MRRRIVSSVLFALALAIQALAPTTVSAALAHFAAGVRCAVQPEASAAARHGAAPDHPSAACGFCQFCCATATPLEARPLASDRALLAPVACAFAAPRGVSAALGHRFAHRARAPPRFSPLVRAVAAVTESTAVIETRRRNGDREKRKCCILN